MIDNKLTVTIGIPAYNEEKSISNILNSIIEQTQKGYVLEKVIVTCDGCTDKTSEVVSEYAKKHSFIEVINDGMRYGQAGRLNRFYKISTSDVFLTFDADTVLGSKDVIEKLMNRFRDPKVALVSGLDTPFAPQNRFERIVTTWLKVWYYTRKNLNGGDSVHNHHGCVSAIRGDFARNLEIPKEIYSNDDYLYFATIKNGYKFSFVNDARVLYRAPNNARDYFLQFTRFLTLKNRVADYFGNWVYAYYKVPTSYKIKGLLTVFIQDPIYLTLAVFFQVALRLFKDKFNDKFKSGVSWETATSTRVLPKSLKGAF